MNSGTVDLRSEPSGRVQTAAFYAVRDLAPGESVVLLTAASPELMMASLGLQLRDAIAWEIAREPSGWRTVVRRRTDTAPSGVIDLLVRDHHRLDGLLAVALRRVNAQDLAGARPLVAAFAAALAAHLRVENELLAPRLSAGNGADDAGPAGSMLREHAEILDQLGAVERALAEPAPEAWEVEPFVAILSGTLAKHEHREESNLFPRWQAALDSIGADAVDALFAEARRTLAGN